VVLVAAGSWMLYSREGCGPLEPLACLARERGARLVLVVAVIYSVTSALGKVGMRHSSPTFFGVAYVGFLALCLAAVALARGEGRAALRELRPTPIFLLIGVVVAGMTFLHFTAIGMTNVAYMVAVKRTSLLVSVVFGRVFFGEAGLRRRLPGAALMLAGVLLLGLGG
jgi:drug/metabolite transporter (DMT)-like permease